MLNVTEVTWAVTCGFVLLGVDIATGVTCGFVLLGVDIATGVTCGFVLLGVDIATGVTCECGGSAAAVRDSQQFLTVLSHLFNLLISGAEGHRCT